MSLPDRNALGLPFSQLHTKLLLGTPLSLYNAVSRFIEKEPEASALLDKTIKRLDRTAEGRRVAKSLRACSHSALHAMCTNCNLCRLSYRRWIIPQAIAYQQLGVETTVATVLIEEIPVGHLQRVNLFDTRDAIKKRLKRWGIKACIGNVEVTFKPERKTWNLHVHLLVFGPMPSESACKSLAARINVPRPVHSEGIKRRRLVRRLSYLFKFVTYYRHPTSPRPLPLPVERLAELANWRTRFLLTDHLILIGFQRRGAIVPGRPFLNLLAFQQRPGDVETWRRHTQTHESAPRRAGTSVDHLQSKTSTRPAVFRL